MRGADLRGLTGLGSTPASETRCSLHRPSGDGIELKVEISRLERRLGPVVRSFMKSHEDALKSVIELDPLHLIQ
jgi:hypothetical protein